MYVLGSCKKSMKNEWFQNGIFNHLFALISKTECMNEREKINKKIMYITTLKTASVLLGTLNLLWWNNRLVCKLSISNFDLSDLSKFCHFSVPDFHLSVNLCFSVIVLTFDFFLLLTYFFTERLNYIEVIIGIFDMHRQYLGRVSGVFV